MLNSEERYIAISGESIPTSIRYWIDAFDADPNWSHMRFKTIGALPGYIPDRFPKRLWDKVSPDEFAQVEDSRLPLFMGTQFGIAPAPNTVLAPGQERRVAMLGYSALSGNVAGLFIKTIKPIGDGQSADSRAIKTIQTLADFRNQKS